MRLLLEKPTLGLDLRSLLFEQLTGDTVLSIQNMILDTFATWLPFVEVRDIRINSNNQADNVNSVIIDIIFTIRQGPNSTSSVTINFDSDINDSTTVRGAG